MNESNKQVNQKDKNRYRGNRQEKSVLVNRETFFGLNCVMDGRENGSSQCTGRGGHGLRFIAVRLVLGIDSLWFVGIGRQNDDYGPIDGTDIHPASNPFGVFR